MKGKDSFQPKTKDDFSLLGLTTNRTLQLISVKGNLYNSNQDQKEQQTSQLGTPRNSPGS